ncbi:MAG: hypothetical protein HY730_09505 [Candidatus Tectomicrobia bacterium]|uniref:PIN domain-containing protein n=1 Tax=Tectimicrobiota bacterium TaxID=2528274 RepID=A0A933GNC6_UNCTE|nr:hypothetical protein [Candidatus Tectomicrobia bacterium]
MILSDTNILSTFAKIQELCLLVRLFGGERIGIVPAVFEELQNGVTEGYVALKPVIENIEKSQIDLVLPGTDEILEKATLPKSFDEGERETIAVAKSRAYAILTNERLIKNWCNKAGIKCFDLPAILSALWRTELLTKEGVQELCRQIEEKDRVVFKDKEQIFID